MTVYKVEDMEFGRRLAVEKELELRECTRGMDQRGVGCTVRGFTCSRAASLSTFPSPISTSFLFGGR